MTKNSLIVRREYTTSTTHIQTITYTEGMQDGTSTHIPHIEVTIWSRSCDDVMISPLPTNLQRCTSNTFNYYKVWAQVVLLYVAVDAIWIVYNLH